YLEQQPIIASIAGTRVACRTSTYRSTESTETGADCGAAPGIARNRPDQGTPCRASPRALKGPRSYRGTGRAGTRRWVPITRRVVLRKKSIGKCGFSRCDINAGQCHKGQEKEKKSQHSAQP